MVSTDGWNAMETSLEDTTELEGTWEGTTVPEQHWGDMITFVFDWGDTSTPDDNATVNITDIPQDKCLEMNTIIDAFFMVFLLVSVCLTFVLSFIVRRKGCYPNFLWGRPGILQPVNFVDEVYRRWAYAACFVLLTNDIMSVFLGDSKLNLLPTDNKEWMDKFGWVRVFTKLLDALAVSLVYFPLLACINHRHSIFANVIGILYLIPWIAIYSMKFHFCPISKEGNFFDSMDYITTIPMYIAFYVIGLSYVMDLVHNIIRKRKRSIESVFTLVEESSKDRKDTTAIYGISHHFDYVENLMRSRKSKNDDEAEKGIKQKLMKIIRRAKYDKIMGFRYSTRLVCCTTTSATFVIWIVVTISSLIESFFQLILPTMQELEKLNIGFINLLVEYMHVTQILFHVANAVSGFIVLCFMVNTLITYKRRWHQLLRGDHSWHIYGTTIDSPASTLLNGLKYAGFQVAYAAWGWIVLSAVLWLALMFLAFAFILPLKKGQINWLIRLLKKMWPTVLLGIIIAIIQKLICKFLFLQDRGAVMALNNRRMYNAASYYFLVLNVIIGFFSCLKRILIPFILGILFLSRLDQPLIMSGFESKDPGYVSFVSMLLVDLYHNHPVVKAFVELMLQVRKKENSFTGINDEKRRRSKIIRNRWWKIITLANNPCLALKALEQRLKEEYNGADQGSQSTVAWSSSIDPVEKDILAFEMAYVPNGERSIITDKVRRHSYV